MGIRTVSRLARSMAHDLRPHGHVGRAIPVAELAREYGFTDIEPEAVRA